MPQDPLDLEARRGPREFTDRESFKQAFDDAFDRLDPKRNSVLMFHGVGGIGKTALLDHLRRARSRRPGLDVAVGHIDFTERENRLPTRTLARTRSQLRADGVPFPSFDVAYAHYWRLAYPDQPLAEAAIPLLDEGEMVAGILDAVQDLPGVNLVSKIPRALDRFGRVARDWWTKRGSEELRELIEETDSSRVAERLRVFWANDVADWLAQSPGQRHAILYIDTLEALGETESTGTRGAAPDDWVRHWIGRLPGVLAVVAGRQKLRWSDRDKTWGDKIEEHLIGGLAPEDSDELLTKAGVAEPDVRAAIVEKSQGVPLYLDLALDTYEMIRQSESRTPGPEEFDDNLGGLLDRFLHYLSDAQRATVTVLSVPSTFDLDRFKDLVSTFHTGVPATADGLATLREFSFVERIDKNEKDEKEERDEKGEPPRYALHGLVREALADRAARDPDRAAEREAIHRHLLAQAEAVLESIDIKAVTEADERALREATEHQKALLSVEEWVAWYWEAEEPLAQAARWAALEPLRAVVLEQVEQALGPDHPDTLLSVNNLGLVLQARGDLAGAEALLRRALAGKEAALGPFHPDTLSSVNNLGYLLFARGDLAGAEPLLRRALAGREAALGPEHLRTLSSVNNLAGLLSARGDLAGAEPLYRRALAGREAALGPEHPDTLGSVHNLAGLLSARGDLAEAEPLYRRALVGFEAALGPEHPHTLTSVNELALLLKARGDLAGAEPLYRRALAGREAALGPEPEHPHTLTSVNNLALLLKDRGDLAGAEPLLRRALVGLEAALGPDHPDTLTSVNNLGMLLQDRGDLAEAEPLLRRALAGTEAALGPEHPDTLTSVNNLGMLLQDRGDLAEAEPLLRRALEGHEAALGPEHPDTLASVNNLGILLQARGDLAGAEPLFRRALAGREAALGPEHLRTLSSVNNLAGLLSARGDLAGAEPLFRRALAGFEAVLGPEHPDTLITVANLAVLLQDRGDLAEAEPLFRRALAGFEAVLGPEHPDTLTSVNNLGYLLKAQGDMAGAEPLMRRAAETAQRVLGSEHPHTKVLRDNLRELLEAQAG